MLKPVHLRKFKNEIEKSKKRGKNMEKIKEVMTLLTHEEPLDQRHKNHKLKGDYIGYWECHIEPDWLLIYRKTEKEIIFARTGTHSDLF